MQAIENCRGWKTQSRMSMLMDYLAYPLYFITFAQCSLKLPSIMHEVAHLSSTLSTRIMSCRWKKHSEQQQLNQIVYPSNRKMNAY